MTDNKQYFLITTEANFVFDDEKDLANKLVEIDRNDAGHCIEYVIEGVEHDKDEIFNDIMIKHFPEGGIKDERN